MIGFELKALIVLLGIISSLVCTSQYEEVYKTKRSFLFGSIEIDSHFGPKRSWWVWLFITISLFTYALYLNDQTPIILF